MGIRFTTLLIGLFLSYSTLLFHLYHVQVSEGTNYLARAGSQYAAVSLSLAKRGSIYFTDKDGARVPAAITKGFPAVIAVPEAMEDRLESANRAALLFNKDPQEFTDMFSGNKTHIVLQRNADAATVAKVVEANIPGVFTDEIPGRFYPFGNLASHLIGFVGPNADDYGESGKYGIERQYEDVLGGTPGRIADGKLVLPTAGENVVLTIDPAIQTEAERVLARLVNEYRADGGSVIVEDPRTGKILAMGNLPTFDPNDYAVSEIGTFLNSVVQKIYEPGSVFKVVTMSAAIDSGSVTPETTYEDVGEVTVSGRTIKNWDLKAHGLMTMTNVLEKSLNTGTVFAEKHTGHATFWKYLKAFGLGSLLDVGLPGELPGDIRTLAEGSPEVNFATASFGQGIAVTPVQMINAVATIANGGKLMRPYVNEAERPQVIREVMKEETARTVTGMIVSAVDKAEVARIPGYSVAGKTGTAYIPDFVYGGYTHNVINTYVGFAPASDPRFVILVKMDNPAGAPLAGLTVVPAFRNLAQFILNYYQIPPDRIGG